MSTSPVKKSFTAEGLFQRAVKHGRGKVSVLPFALILLPLSMLLVFPPIARCDEGAARISLDPDAGEAAPGRGRSNPVRLWPVLDVRTYDRSRDGVDERRPDLLSLLEAEILWPIFSHYEWEKVGGERGGHTHLFPFYWSARKGNEGYSVFFPAYWSMFNETSSWFHFFPFYGEYSSGSYKKTFLLDPAISYGRDSATGEWDADVLWPLAHFEGDSKSKSGRAIPFLFFGRSKDRDYTFAPPLYFSERNGDSGFRFLLPFWWERWRAGDKNWHDQVLFPFWGRFEWPEDEGVNRVETLFPFYWDVIMGGARTRMFAPLWFSNENERRSDTVLFPLFWDFRDKETGDRTTVAIPVYLLDRRDGGKSGVQAFSPLLWNWWNPAGVGFGLFPLFWRWRGEKHSNNVLFPLFFDSSNRETGARTTVAIPFYLLNRGAGAKAGVRAITPLFWNWWNPSGSGLSLFPLFWSWRGAEERADVLFPLFWNWSDRSERFTAALPVFMDYVRNRNEPGYRRGWTSILGPAWVRSYDEAASECSHDVLWPLISFSKSGDRSHSRWLPLWWYDRKGDREFLLAPFTACWKQGKGTSLSVMFPAFRYASKPEAGAWKIDLLWPLFSAGRRDGVSHNRLVPLWWHDADDHESLTLVPGLSSWAYTQGDLKSVGLLFPLFKYRGQGGNSQVDLLWPLFSVRNEGDEAHSRLLPLWWHEGDTESSTTIVPPLLSFQRRKGNSGFGSVLFPLTWYSWGRGEGTEVRLLWELSRLKLSGDGDWDFRLLYKLVHLGSNAGGFECEFNPLFRFETRRGRLMHFSLLGGALFSYDYDPVKRDSETRLFYLLNI